MQDKVNKNDMESFIEIVGSGGYFQKTIDKKLSVK